MNTNSKYRLFKRRVTGQYIITELLSTDKEVEIFSTYSEAISQRAFLRFKANEDQSTIY